MSRGLYTMAQIARYFGTRPQEVARMAKDDGLPVVKLPGAKQPVKKITLHGLHEWLSGRHSGTAFMTVEQLAAEIEAANEPERVGYEVPKGMPALPSEGVHALRAAVEMVFESIKFELERKKAA